MSRFKFYIKEVREGCIEVMASTKEEARKNVMAGGFQSYGQVDCNYSRKVFEKSDDDCISVNEALDEYEKRLGREIEKSVNDIPPEWTNESRISVQQRLEWVRNYLMPEVREEILKNRE
jgi:Ethanolamine utilization protein EutJ (predicted chaperonin)